MKSTPYALAHKEGGGVGVAAAGSALVRLITVGRGGLTFATYKSIGAYVGGFNSAGTILIRSPGLRVRQQAHGSDHYMGFLQIVNRYMNFSFCI